MHFARAMGGERGIVGVYLGCPEHVRIVFGPVKSIKERAGFFRAWSSKGANTETCSPALPSLTVTRATIATCDTVPPGSQPAREGPCRARMPGLPAQQSHGRPGPPGSSRGDSGTAAFPWSGHA
jgi:hypothetical protein